MAVLGDVGHPLARPEELAEASCSVPAYERENDPHNGALDDAAFEEEDDE